MTTPCQAPSRDRLGKRFDFRNYPELSQTAKLVGELLDRTTALIYDKSLMATKTIAKEIGRSLSTATVALRELKKAGLVKVKRCWWASSRHVIELKWRTPAQTNFLGAENCAGPALKTAPDSSPPLDSPIRSLKAKAKEIDGGKPDAPPLPIVSRQSREEETIPIPAEFNAQVERITEAKPEKRSSVLTLVRRWLARPRGRETVKLALSRAVEREESEGLANPPGYLNAVLRGIEDDGGPPPEIDEEAEAARKAEEARQFDAGMLARFAARRAEEAAAKTFGGLFR